MNKPVRILHIVTCMSIGGLESRLMDLYRNINKDLIQFDFYTLRKEKKYFDDEIIKMGGKIFYNNPINLLSLFKNQKEFRNVLINNSYDIIHSHICELSPILLSVAKKLGIPVRIVHSRHANLPFNLKWIYKNVCKLFIPVTGTHFLSVSDKAGYWLFGKKLMYNGKVKIIKNGIQAEAFKFNPILRSIKRNELGFSDDELVFGLVANFTYAKNHIFLVDVFAEIAKQKQKVKLILIGDGNKLKIKVENKVKKLGIEDKVCFLGKRNDIRELLQAMDIFLMPSKYEGMPGAALEAQAAGLPVVLSTSISRDVKIIDLVLFISLKKNKVFWANQIMVFCNNLTKREDTYKNIIEAGYDINSTTKWYHKFYINLNTNIRKKND